MTQIINLFVSTNVLELHRIFIIMGLLKLIFQVVGGQGYHECCETR